MTEVNPALVEKYQLMMQEDPRSKVFAPLAEAYRKMGLIEEALQLCLKGVEYHPDFAGGRVALGRLHLAKGNLTLATQELQKAVDLSPENILAQSLKAECHLKLRQPKEALAAYKMLLFLNPQDERAQTAVKRLESLTADEYDEDLFQMTQLKDHVARSDELAVEEAEPLKPVSGPEEDARRARDLERFISLSDAFMVRNDFDRAHETLVEAERVHGDHPEIVKRLKLLNQRHLEDEVKSAKPPIEPRSQTAIKSKLALLQELNQRIDRHRRKA